LIPQDDLYQDGLPRILPLALFYIVLLAGVVGDCAASGSCTGTDESAFWTAQNAADDSTADGGASDNLSAGMVTMVAAGLGALCGLVPIVGDLCHNRERHSRCDGCKGEGRDELAHGSVPFQLL
jgi:hypothetical protein